MGSGYGKGTITVFLSLVCTLFLSLLCTAAESVRVQGCRAKAAAALDMGMFSVMGEYERELLEHYDVFFLDGAAGTGVYSQEKINESLRNFMEYNVDANKGFFLRGFEPFGLTLEDTQVTGVTLMTDANGGAFYQQAVRYMKENAATEIVSTLLGRKSEAEQLENAGEQYKSRDDNVGEQLKELERQQREQEQAAQNGDGAVTPVDGGAQAEPVPESRNPLVTIKKLKKKGLLGLVAKDQISDKELPSGSPSKRGLNQGNLPVETENSGFVADLLFQEYLFQRFSLYTDTEKEAPLDYALEYILCGKNSDRKNLKSVVTRLLLLREGANFLYLASDGSRMAAAQAMATMLVGAIPVPGLVVVTAYALLLGWAFGESLLDVRELLAGGKVPVFKSADTWKLELNSILYLPELLENTNGSSDQGLTYAQYLQMLFLLGKKGSYAMRALDLVEGYMRNRPSTGAFRVDNAVCKIQTKAEFNIPQLFLRVPAAFLGTGGMTQDYQATGTFGY